MAKKIIAWLLVVVLTAGAAIGGTLAYLTDRDSEANVFTVGDVKIDLNEDFNQGATLIPGVDIVKKPTIKNIGPNDAWVWTTYAIPKALDGHVSLHYSSNNPPVQPTFPDELQDALNVDGVTVVLTKDITIDGNTEFMNTASKGVLVEIKDANVVLDMNGHTINVTADAVKDGESFATALFAVREGSLTVIGNGEINIHNQAIAFYCWIKSDISIYGDITVNSNSYERKESDLYVNNEDASLHVYAGTYNGYGINVKDNLVGSKLFVGEGVTFGDEYKNLFDADLNRGRLRLEENAEVVNIGTTDSPLWQVKYIEGTAEAPIHEFEWIDGGLVGTTTIDGVEYNLYSRLYNTPLASGATTTEDLIRVTLDKRVDITPEGDWYIVDQGVTTPIGWKNSNGNPVIYVSAYAIQAEGFANVSAAYAAYQTQWGDNGSEYGAPPEIVIVDGCMAGCIRYVAEGGSADVYKLNCDRIHRYVFSDGRTDLSQLIIHEGIRQLDDRSLAKAPTLTSVILPSSLEIIEEGAFQQSNFKTLEIPENVTYIGKTAMGACPQLESIVIKAKNVTIANYMARDNGNLREVYIYSDSVTFAEDSNARQYFTNTQTGDASKITFYVSSQEVADALYHAATGSHWNGMLIKSLDGSVTYYNTLK